MARILLIDDDVAFTRALEEHLRHEGFDVSTAAFGADGVSMALNQPPDLTMVDLMLPDETGYQVCGKLRQSPATKSMPIIMMTGSTRLPSQQALSRLMGADDYLPKPFRFFDASDRVHRLLGSQPRPRPVELKPAPVAKVDRLLAQNAPRATIPAGFVLMSAADMYDA